MFSSKFLEFLEFILWNTLSGIYWNVLQFNVLNKYFESEFGILFIQSRQYSNCSLMLYDIGILCNIITLSNRM